MAVTKHGGIRVSRAFSRFFVLFAVQTAVLLVIVGLCYRGLGQLRDHLDQLRSTLPKATAAAEVLHSTDVLRVIHVTLLGAAGNAEYVEQRLVRLREVEQMTEKSLVTMEKLDWSPAEREQVRFVIQGMRAYMHAFPPVLAAARTATPAELPDLIQANTAYRRDAYNQLLQMLPEIQRQADSIVQVNASQFRRMQAFILAGLAITILLSISIFRAFLAHSRQTRRQADELNRSMTALRDGDLTSTCAVISHDELGRVAENLNEIFAILASNIATVLTISGKLEIVAETVSSRSNQVIRGAEEQNGAVGTATASIGKLNEGIRGITLNVDALSASATETSTSTIELAASMEEVARHTDTLFASVGETASATHEMVATINEVDQNVESLKGFVTDTSASMVEMSASIAGVEREAGRSHELARQVCTAAESGMHAVTETIGGMEVIRSAVEDANRAMADLGERSDEIGRIVNVIGDIATQTNLLALNAAILAAQAGSQGRGFAVVADEIRGLAERSAAATKEIGSLISAVQKQVDATLSAMTAGARHVDDGVKLAGEAGRALEKILDSAAKSLDMGSSIAGAMQEQARSSETISASVAHVQDMVRQINSATGQQAAGSTQILAAVEQIREVTGSVRQATVAQRGGSAMIADATEVMIDMVREISGAAVAQAGECATIVTTMEHVRAIAEDNRQSAHDMTESVRSLTQSIRELESEVRKFRVAETPRLEIRKPDAPGVPFRDEYVATPEFEVMAPQTLHLH